MAPPPTSETTLVAADDSTPSIARLSIKVPPFWPEKPSLWFVQLESQFALSKITCDDTKYFYVCANLDSKFALEVEDILTQPPATDKYTLLKKELISRLSASQDQKIKRLLETEEIGDRTPSQFLRHLKTLAGTEIPEAFLKTLWLKHLPDNIQAILATQGSSTLDSIATLADKMSEIFAPTQQIAATSTASQTTVAELAMQVKTLTQQLAEMSRGRSQDRRDSARHRSRSQSNSICWYHRRFKQSARKCIKPCAFSKNEIQDL